MALFNPFNFVTICQFYFITSRIIHYTSLRNYKMREKKIFLAYMTASAYHVISKEVENHIFDTIEFLETHLSKQPTLTK